MVYFMVYSFSALTRSCDTMYVKQKTTQPLDFHAVL